MENMHIVAWVAPESQNQGLIRWFIMQCIEESSTPRVPPKKDKPSPRTVYHHGKQDEQIRYFLKSRKLIIDIVEDAKVIRVRGTNP